MKLEQMTIKELLDTKHTIAERLFDGHEYPWEVLPEIGNFIETLGPLLPETEYTRVGTNIWMHKTAKIAPTIMMGGPMIICAGAQVRQGAFLRGRVIIGEKAVIGNSCELKNAVVFDEAQIPHFNYVGDSIVGYKAHMGAGAVTSNVKSDKGLVKVHAEDGEVETGFKKFGAVLADGAEIGCNSVLNPGTVVGRNSIVYPLSSVRGCVPADSIYKGQDAVVSRLEEAPKAKTTRRKAAPKTEEGAKKPAAKKRSTTASKSGLKVVEKKED